MTLSSRQVGMCQKHLEDCQVIVRKPNLQAVFFWIRFSGRTFQSYITVESQGKTLQIVGKHTKTLGNLGGTCPEDHRGWSPNKPKSWMHVSYQLCWGSSRQRTQRQKDGSLEQMDPSKTSCVMYQTPTVVSSQQNMAIFYLPQLLDPGKKSKVNKARETNLKTKIYVLLFYMEFLSSNFPRPPWISMSFSRPLWVGPF